MKSIVIHIILLVCSSIIWGQDEYITIEASPNPVEKGENLVITIKSNIEGQLDFKLPDEFEQSGPAQSGMSSSVKYENGRGTVIRFSYQRLAGHFEDEGTFRIGPAKIRGKNGTVSSNVLEVKVLKRQNMISQNPVDNLDRAIFGIIQQSSNEIYEGQPLILEGKVYAQVELLQVERYKPFEFEGPAETHELQQTNQVTKRYEQIGGRNVMTFRIGKALVFPEKTGTFEIESFETTLLYDDQRSIFPERAKIRSNESTVTIKPLPNGVPSSFIEGVGKFSLEASVDTNKLKQGSVLTLRVNVKGHGNIHNIEAPKLKLPKGMILYGDPEVVDSIKYTARGSEGTKSFVYYIQANKSGNIDLPKIEAAYFDVRSEEYRVLETTLPVIVVQPSDNAVAGALPKKEEEPAPKEKILPPMDQDQLKGEEDSIFVGLKGVIWSCTPIALAFLLGMVVRRRKSTEATRATKQEADASKQQVLDELNAISVNADDKEALQTVKLAVQNYLALKFDTQPAEISVPFIKTLSSDKINDDTKESVISLFNSIDELRYSGGAVQADGEHIAKTAKRVINQV
jgi:hypothetical protein